MPQKRAPILRAVIGRGTMRAIDVRPQLLLKISKIFELGRCNLVRGSGNRMLLVEKGDVRVNAHVDLVVGGRASGARGQ